MNKPTFQQLRNSIGVLAAGAILGWSAPASAEVSSTGKGTVGGALLGGEAVLMLQAAFGTQEAWAYAVGGVAGAAAGGVGGYFIEQEASPRVNLGLLFGGMALIIPTVILCLDAAQDAPPSLREEAPPTDAPTPDPPQPGQSPELASAPTRERVPAGTFVDLGAGDVSLAMPNVVVSAVHSPEEVQRYGVRQQTQVLVPLLGARF